MANSKYEYKRWHGILLLVIFCSGALFKLYQYYWPKVNIAIGDQTIVALLADTREHQIIGWGKRDNMGRFGGMLFPYNTRAQHTMVMRAMNFPIDIVWLDVDADSECRQNWSLRSFFFKSVPDCSAIVVDIAPNVQPEPGKTESQLTPYFGRSESIMVLELPAGFKDQTGLKIGDRVEIEL